MHIPTLYFTTTACNLPNCKTCKTAYTCAACKPGFVLTPQGTCGCSHGQFLSADYKQCLYRCPRGQPATNRKCAGTLHTQPNLSIPPIYYIPAVPTMTFLCLCVSSLHPPAWPCQTHSWPWFASLHCIRAHTRFVYTGFVSSAFRLVLLHAQLNRLAAGDTQFFPSGTNMLVPNVIHQRPNYSFH